MPPDLLALTEQRSLIFFAPAGIPFALCLLLVLGALLTSKPLCQALPVLQWAPLQLMGQLLYNCLLYTSS